MEEQILRFFLKVFSLILIISVAPIYLSFNFSLNKNIIFENKIIKIEKGENIQNILKKNTKNINSLDILISKLYFKFNNIYTAKFIHYGKFYINKKFTLIELIGLISKPSKFYKRITIIEGWSNKQLKNELSKNFNNILNIPYSDILADTYYIDHNMNFSSFLEVLRNFKINYFNKKLDNELLKFYSMEDIIIIGSLLEKEGLGIEDKRNISSVILNRLKQGMRLQIDATVIYAITDGEYNLNRNLLISDLKIKHPYNTYIIKGLPPKPIAYVGKKTLDIIFENYKSDFLFYFFNKSLNRHIFSKTYKEHKFNLNEYRKTK